jgi:hypothetical protein
MSAARLTVCVEALGDDQMKLIFGARHNNIKKALPSDTIALPDLARARAAIARE